MNGTDQIQPSCTALVGEIGVATTCGIYVNRPGACRNFSASFENGLVGPDCEKARLGKGLRLLSATDWV